MAEVKIEKLVSGCLGFTELNGKATLVYNALPGEWVNLTNVKERKGFIEADAEIKTFSEERVEPICPFYGVCGGCDFQIAKPESQVYFKNDIVKDNLKRIGKLDLKKVKFLEPEYGRFKGYRSRSRFHVNLKTKDQGFLKRGTNELIPLKYCPALSDALNEKLAERGGDVYESARRLMFENKVNRRSGLVEVPLISSLIGDVSLGKEEIEIDLGIAKYKVNANVFFQSNLVLLPSLLSFVKSETVGDKIMDLYSGVGTFSALFKGKKVWAVERQAECLELSKKNAPWATSFTSDVALWAKSSKEKPDTVIVDPPRGGLEEEAPLLISSFSPERIIYVSCNSVTASRDIPRLLGYELKKVKVFGFYPGTGHEEAVFVLDRKS